MGKNRWVLFKVFFSGILSSILTVLIPVSIGKYYNLVFNFSSYRSQVLDYLPFDAGRNVNSFLYFFIALIILKAICLFGEKFFIGILKERLAFDLRNRLFFEQLNLPLPIYEQKGIGKYLLRFSGDLTSIQNYLARGIIRFFIDLTVVAITFAIIFSINWVIGLAVTTVFLLTIILLILLNKKLSITTRNKRNQKSSLLAFVNTRLRTISTVKLLNRHHPENKKYYKKSQFLYSYGISYQKTAAFIRTVIPFAMYLMLVAVLFFVYFLTKNGVETEGSSLLVMILLLITLLPVFNRLLRVNIDWELGSISFEKLFKVINASNTTQQNELPTFQLKKGSIKIENMCYGYENNSLLFNNLNLSILPNGITLLTGDTGSGKTTLLKLLCGMYIPSSGNILIDEQVIHQVNAKSLIKNIAVISDETPLLGKTVFEAISYSRKVEKKKRAELILNELQFKNTKKIKLEDRIGDLGNHLSKGEKKLLVIARALLSSKPILLLDEPFEGLNVPTQKQLCKILNKRSKRQTIVVFSKHQNFDGLNIKAHININQSQKPNTSSNHFSITSLNLN